MKCHHQHRQLSECQTENSQNVYILHPIKLAVRSTLVSPNHIFPKRIEPNKMESIEHELPEDKNEESPDSITKKSEETLLLFPKNLLSSTKISPIHLNHTQNSSQKRRASTNSNESNTNCKRRRLIVEELIPVTLKLGKQDIIICPMFMIQC